MKKPTASSVKKINIVPSSASSGTFVVNIAESGRLCSNPSPDNPNVEDAVFSYIQALRVLGRTVISKQDIAESLGIPYSAVNNAVNNMRERGVKPIK